MCSYAELQQEIQSLGADVRSLRAEIEMLTGRMTAVETRVQDAVLTQADVQRAINETGVLTRAEFEQQLFTTVGEVGARIRTVIKRAVYGVAGFLGVVLGIVLALERIWGVFT